MMNRIFGNKHHLTKLCSLLLVIFCSNLAKAQPGLRDHTARYSYNIIDENGREISFKNNKNYSIMVDSALYKAPNIPQDSLKSALYNTYIFETQIRINDFSLAVPNKPFHERQRQLEIKIIHNTDTMHICQASGMGSFHDDLIFQDKPKTIPPDFTLQFIAGHYYFTSWASRLLKNLPKTNGNTKIVNIDQRHFIVPETFYDAISLSRPEDDTRRELYDKAENWVVNNFMKGHFLLARSAQPTTFDRSVLPFNNPRWGYWENPNPYYATKNKDEYLGGVDFSFDTLKWSGERGVLVRFNKNENKMGVWSPTENLLYSSTSQLHQDPFNNVYYNRSIIRDSTCKELVYKCKSVTKFYRSTDEGKTWEEDKRLTQLYKKHEFRNLEFLDQNHALIFAHKKIKQTNSKHDLIQGAYYLLKDFSIIDSLKTPEDIYYNDNYNRYDYRAENDTVFLGSWTYIKYDYPRIGKPYFQPFVKKIDGKWKFQVVQQTYFSTAPKPQEPNTIAYQNFEIVNNKELVFKNNGSLVFNNEVSELHKKGLLLENGKQIYLIGLGIGTLLSFDGGNSWCVYPLPLEKDSRYEFLEIDEQGLISHLKNSWSKNGYEFNKVFHKFSPEYKHSR